MKNYTYYFNKENHGVMGRYYRTDGKELYGYDSRCRNWVWLPTFIYNIDNQLANCEKITEATMFTEML